LAGITDLHFHDLRGTAITMLGEAGCTVPEIASITGHSFKSVETILEKYLARTKALANSAMSKFENASSTSFANRLQTSHPGGVADEA
jgi:integrase